MNRFNRYKWIGLDHLSQLVAGITEARDKALFLLLIDTGLRTGEVIQLDRDSVELGDGQNSGGARPHSGTGMTRNGKSRTHRRFCFTAQTVDALTTYLRDRGDDGLAALFVSKSGRLTPPAIRRMMHGWCDVIGIERIGPRQLRYHFVATLVKAGFCPLDLGLLLGQSNWTTLHYYRLSIDPEEGLHNQVLGLDSGPVPAALISCKCVSSC